MDGNGGSGRPGDEEGPGDEDGPGNEDRPGGGSGPGRWTVPGYFHERVLGEGASGQVVLARHEATGTAVAVKYLVGRLGRDHDFRTAFRGEAELLGGLHSPYIARFYEYVEDGPHAAIVMELVEGISLHALLRAEGATDPEPALAVLKGSLLGLAAAHAAGVVHRDYKPGNVLVGTDGLSRLVDFGVAVRSGESGTVAGTPSYMAPEQWAGGPATPATDVYAATATFYECLTGTKPYAGATMFELAVQHTEAPIPDERVPEQVRPLISRGLAKTPPERPQSAADFVAELQALATAAYGADWEERGQRKLAALVALLPLLLPLAGGGHAAATTALAHTEFAKGGGAGGAPPGPGAGAAGAGGAGGAGALAAAGAGAVAAGLRRTRFGPRGKLLAGAVAAVLFSAGIAVTAVATSGSGPAADASTTTTPTAVTSLVSGTPVAAAATTPADGSPPASPSAAATSPGVSPSASATATTTATATATGTATPSATVTLTPPVDPASIAAPTTAAPDGGTPTATPTTPTAAPTPTATPPTKAPPATTPPPALHISLVLPGSLSCVGRDAARGTVSIRGDGAAAGTLYVSWFHVSRSGAVTALGTDAVRIPAGNASFTAQVRHAFGGRDISPTWGMTVSTDPAAGKGQNSSQTLSSGSCRFPVIG